MELILSLAQGAFCAYILIIAVMVYIEMRPHTRPSMRASYILFGAAALHGLLTCTHPAVDVVSMSAGLALFLANQERRGQRAA